MQIGSLLIIAPHAPLLKNVRQALRLIQSIDNKEYSRLFSRLKVIFITNKNGYTNEFFMPEKIWFTNKSLIKNNDVSWVASLIIHEAFHATQFKKGKYILPLSQLEKPALRVQDAFLRKIKTEIGKDSVRRAFKEKYWETINNDLRSFAYFRNLLTLYKSGKLKIT